MAALIRKPGVALIWAGQNVTHDLAPYIEELTFTDSLQSGQGQRDEISLKLNNADGRFLNDWWPTNGDTLQPAITWQDDSGNHRWPLGTFAIDGGQIRRAPATLTVKGLSQKIDRTALEQHQNRAWDKIKLSALVAQIATENGLRTHFDAEDTHLGALNQRNESAHALLTRLAKRYHARYAIKGDTIVWTDKDSSQVFTIDWHTGITAGDFALKARTAYAKATLQYYDAADDTLLTHTQVDKDATGNRVLKLYDTAKNLADARRIATAALTGANKSKGGSGNLTLPGRPIAAGDRIDLIHAGRLSGSWKTVQATHTVHPDKGWTTRLNVESNHAR